MHPQSSLGAMLPPSDTTCLSTLDFGQSACPAANKPISQTPEWSPSHQMLSEFLICWDPPPPHPSTHTWLSKHLFRTPPAYEVSRVLSGRCFWYILRCFVHWYKDLIIYHSHRKKDNCLCPALPQCHTVVCQGFHLLLLAFPSCFACFLLQFLSPEQSGAFYRLAAVELPMPSEMKCYLIEGRTEAQRI